ncbi:MAG: hypothetical protein AABZ32_02790 [Bacteroidota bacterium]
MNTKRFFLSWILSSLTMFSLSYLWHGIFLNDLERLSYPKEIFFAGSIVTYLILGFLVTKIYLMKFPKQIATKPLVRGIISGALLGIATYVVSLVIGVSFNSTLTPQYILFDVLWQTVEQTFGGITVAFVYISIYDGNPVEIITRKMFGGD